MAKSRSPLLTGANPGLVSKNTIILWGKKKRGTEEAMQEIMVLKELAVSRDDGSICGRECCHK